MTAIASKLPAAETPLIRDPDLSAAIERLLDPFNGKQLLAAQNAVRRVHGSSVQGHFGEIVEAYRKGIVDAVSKTKGD